MDAINYENLRAYCNSVYDEYEFDSHLETTYNMDETGVPLEP